MKATKIWRIALAMLAVLSLASCSSEPEWADPEAHEKTEQLRERYTPLIVGTWHIEYITDKWRFYERLTFNGDGTLAGMRKWQSRGLVTIGGTEQYTDWQDVDGENDTFSGTWKLSWSRETDDAPGGNRLMLWASFDHERDWGSAMAYSLNASFVDADEATLSIGGGTIRNGDGGTTVYTRGDAEPSF